jgi:hypothetical protein
MFTVAISGLCLFWMHSVVRRITARHAPHVAQVLEDPVA